MLSTLINLAGEYWGIVVVVIAIAASIIGGNKSTAKYAKSRIKTLMIAAEKRAEQLGLTNGPVKLAWVVDKGYDMLPGVVRLFISKPLFTALVQAEYDLAVQWAEKHLIVPLDAPVPAA